MRSFPHFSWLNFKVQGLSRNRKEVLFFSLLSLHTLIVSPQKNCRKHLSKWYYHHHDDGNLSNLKKWKIPCTVFFFTTCTTLFIHWLKNKILTNKFHSDEITNEENRPFFSFKHAMPCIPHLSHSKVRLHIICGYYFIYLNTSEEHRSMMTSPDRRPLWSTLRSKKDFICEQKIVLQSNNPRSRATLRIP